MRNFQDTFELRKRSFISAFSICMTVPLSLILTVFLFSGFNLTCNVTSILLLRSDLFMKTLKMRTFNFDFYLVFNLSCELIFEF